MLQGSRWRAAPLYRGVCWGIIAFFAVALGAHKAGAGPSGELPPFSLVKQAVDRHFVESPDYRPGDIIAKSDVEPIFQQLQQLGWTVADRQAIQRQLLGDSQALVSTLRTKPGRLFMRKVSGYGMIYDRLDRVSREPGGKQMLRSLVQLPDGERYAKPQPAPGVPGLVDFLPKNASGKTRKVADYDKPTGMIYTAAQLIRRLEESHARAEQAARSR